MDDTSIGDRAKTVGLGLLGIAVLAGVAFLLFWLLAGLVAGGMAAGVGLIAGGFTVQLAAYVLTGREYTVGSVIAIVMVILGGIALAFQ